MKIDVKGMDASKQHDIYLSVTENKTKRTEQTNWGYRRSEKMYTWTGRKNDGILGHARRRITGA